MTMKVFFELVEIRTKLASLFPFLVGLLFSAFFFGQVNAENMLLFFLAMLVFDMATTAINNLMDFKKAKNDDYQENTNIVGVAKLSEKKVAYLIYTMIAFSSVIGLYLTIQTSLLLLLLTIIANSSPPNLAGTSFSPAQSRNIDDIRDNTASPTSCP